MNFEVLSCKISRLACCKADRVFGVLVSVSTESQIGRVHPGASFILLWSKDVLSSSLVLRLFTISKDGNTQSTIGECNLTSDTLAGLRTKSSIDVACSIYKYATSPSLKIGRVNAKIEIPDRIEKFTAGGHSEQQDNNINTKKTFQFAKFGKSTSWAHLNIIDPDRMIKEGANPSKLKSFGKHLPFVHLHTNDEDVKPLCNALQMGQLSLQYLIHCNEVMQHNTHNIKRESRLLDMEEESLDLAIRRLKVKIKALRKESKSISKLQTIYDDILKKDFALHKTADDGKKKDGINLENDKSDSETEDEREFAQSMKVPSWVNNDLRGSKSNAQSINSAISEDSIARPPVYHNPHTQNLGGSGGIVSTFQNSSRNDNGGRGESGWEKANSLFNYKTDRDDDDDNDNDSVYKCYGSKADLIKKYPDGNDMVKDRTTINNTEKNDKLLYAEDFDGDTVDESFNDYRGDAPSVSIMKDTSFEDLAVINQSIEFTEVKKEEWHLSALDKANARKDVIKHLRLGGGNIKMDPLDPDEDHNAKSFDIDDSNGDDVLFGTNAINTASLKLGSTASSNKSESDKYSEKTIENSGDDAKPYDDRTKKSSLFDYGNESLELSDYFGDQRGESYNDDDVDYFDKVNASFQDT